MSALAHYDAIVVGGGPAGSSCAARLVEGGAKVAVLDREEFPRTKLCAGWVTPEAMADLDLDPADYPRRFITFEQIVAHIKGLSFKLNTPQHSIRRYEFDDIIPPEETRDVLISMLKMTPRAPLSAVKKHPVDAW